MSEGSISNHISQIILGSVSIGISKTTSAPLERVRLVMQLQGGFIPAESFPKYRSITKTLIKLPSEQGILSYWRGNLTHILIYFPNQIGQLSLFYSFYSTLAELKKQPEQTQISIAYLYTNLSIIVPALFSYPLQIMWTKYVTDISPEGRKNSLASDFRQLYSEVGPTGLYRGALTHLAGKIAYRPVQLTLFDYFHKNFLSDQDAFKTFLYAQVSTLLAGLAAYPFDTISRRIMLQIGEKEYFSTLQIVSHIYRNEGGIFGFYRGWLCILINAVFQATILQVFDRSFRNN